MTVDHADGQDYAVWRTGNLLASVAQNLPVGSTVLGPFTLGNFAGVLLRVIPQSQYGTAQLSWYLDSALTQPCGTDSWTVTTTTALVARVPARGFYATLTLTNDSVAAAAWNVTLLPDNNVAGSVFYPVTNNKITTGLVSYALSSTTFYQLPFIQPGQAWCMADPNDTTGKLQFDIVSFTELGALSQYLHRFGLITSPVGQMAGLTADICGLQVINTDAAAAHSARFTLIAGMSGQG